MTTMIVNHSWGKGRAPPTRGRSEGLNLIFCDPPYNQGVQYEDDPSGDQLSDGDYQSWCRSSIREMSEMLAPGGTFWWLCPERHADFIGPQLSAWIGPRLYRVVFEESFAQYQQRTLTQDYRMLFCHQKPGGPLTFNPDAIRERSTRQEMGDKRADPRGRVPGQVWKMRRLQGTSRHRVDWHPAQLCPELLQRVVRGWTRPGDYVMDGFGGSGNMGMVCELEKRNCVLVDQSITYVGKMGDRIWPKEKSAK